MKEIKRYLSNKIKRNIDFFPMVPSYENLMEYFSNKEFDIINDPYFNVAGSHVVSYIEAMRRHSLSITDKTVAFEKTRLVSHVDAFRFVFYNGGTVSTKNPIFYGVIMENGEKIPDNVTSTLHPYMINYGDDTSKNIESLSEFAKEVDKVFSKA